MWSARSSAASAANDRPGGQSRMTEIEVHAEVLHQPLHAAAHLHGDGIGVQLPLGGLHHEQLALDVLEPLRSRQKGHAAGEEPSVRDVADVVQHVGGFVLGHLLEAVVEIVGDGVAGPRRLLPAFAADQHQRGIALRIEVHHQHLLPAPGRRGMGQHDGDGRFADAALSVRYGKELRHSSPTASPRTVGKQFARPRAVLRAAANSEAILQTAPTGHVAQNSDGQESLTSAERHRGRR